MLVTKVRDQMVNALKSGDKDTKNILALLVAALDKAAKEKKSELTEFEEGQIVLKLMKQVQETIDTCPSERTDIIEKAKSELNTLSKFAPVQMNKDDILQEINLVLIQLGIEHPKPADKGRIMSALMTRVKGKADGKMVNEILMGMLK